MKYYLFSVLSAFLGTVLLNNTHAQETSKWTQSFTGELYQFEDVQTYSKGGSLNANYSGQSFRYSLERAVSKHVSVGLESGLFVHSRSNNLNRAWHSYIPVQLVMRLSSNSKRFALSLSAGYPIFLTKKNQYVGSGGFWYKPIFHTPPAAFENEYYEVQARLVDKYYLVAALRLHFSISRTNKWYINTGIQYYGFSSHFYGGGFYHGPYYAFKYGNCVNLSVGVSYRFGPQ